MSTNPNARNPSVQVNEHSGFALELTAYVNEARGAMSVRAFHRRSSAGSLDHWAKILAGTKVMTTNDVKVAADVLGIDPYDLVEGARRLAGHNVTPFPNVGAHDEDYQQSEFPTTQPAAAETKRGPGDD